MARREKGNGTISQRKDGTWTGRMFLGYKTDGKQKIKAVYGKTEKEVKKKLKELQIETIKYGQAGLPKITMSELMFDWLNNIKKYELKPSSLDRVEITINKHIEPYIGYIQVQNIAPTDIQKLINNMVDKGYSYSTIKKVYNVINTVLKLALERDYIRKNPCIGIALPKQMQRSKSEIVFFSDDEIKKIIKSATEKYKTGKYIYKHGYSIVILLNTGMRIGELLALKWSNGDVENKQIHIAETRGQIVDRSDNDHKYIMSDRSTKTQASNRYIPINKQTEEALLYFKSLKYDNPYVMANSNKNVVSYRNLHRVLSQILKKNNINHGSLHSLRHTFATRLFRNGIDINVISELLGHSDISITYNIYTHVIQEQKKKAVDILNNL